jgi:predicted nuclease of predicted toxin-antitoxin system
LAGCATSAEIARWITTRFSIPAIPAIPVRDLGLRGAGDEEIFSAAKSADVIVLTKDGDFVQLLERHGCPPKILWLTCGNTSEASLQQILEKHLEPALALLGGEEEIVEIGPL